MSNSGSCRDCAVAVGQSHDGGCDVARCLETGVQRLSCDEPHDCGDDVWTGVWPGVSECREFGWFVQDRCDEGLGWVPCDKDAPDATEDLNRLRASEAVWSPERKRWVLRQPS